MTNTLSPKSDFIADAKKAGEWQDVVLNPAFKEAAKTALLEYAMSLAHPKSEGPTLSVVGLRLQGAKEVLEVLMNLGRQVKPPNAPDDDQLDPI